MMLQALFMTFLSGPAGTPTVEWQAPRSFREGGAGYTVMIDVRAGAEGGTLDAWALTPAAFDLNGQPIAERAEGALQLAAGAHMTLEFDLAPYFAQAPGYVAGQAFSLGYSDKYTKTEPIQVRTWQAAPQGLNFMELPEAELGNYLAVLSTNRGEIVLEFWPETAPGHVRNFLDLAYTGFYDGVTFHRVMRGFMIQGGDPSGNGTGNGKRMLDAEFSNRKHVRGVLSMARKSGDVNSASCQFFIMHKDNATLDTQYSAFGEVLDGMPVVDKIAETPCIGEKPAQPQVIEKASVVVKPKG